MKLSRLIEAYRMPGFRPVYAYKKDSDDADRRYVYLERLQKKAFVRTAGIVNSLVMIKEHGKCEISLVARFESTSFLTITDSIASDVAR